MANDLAIWAILGILAFAVFGGQGQPQAAGGTGGTSGNGGTSGFDPCTRVEPEASLTGQRLFLTGTSLTGEYARVFNINGDNSKRDLTQISMNSGTLTTDPKGEYVIYWGENSSTYYTNKEVYTAPCQDATDNKVGTLCAWDTTPTLTTFDEFGNVQSASANAQAVDSSEEIDVKVQIKVSADNCWGNPNAPEGSNFNVICFEYNNTVFDKVEVIGGTAVSAPNQISTAKAAAALVQSCYKHDVLTDTGKIDLPVKLDAATGQNPTTSHNVTIRVDDVDMDLNQDTLAEIWGFEDESKNDLGVSTAITAVTLYVS